MRNVIVTIIALAIVAGVLAKNPPASAPTLAASTAALPRRMENPVPARIVEPVRSTAVVEPATVAASKTEEPVTAITTEGFPTGTKATLPDAVNEAVVPVRLENSAEVVSLKTSRKADEPKSKQIAGSSVEPKTTVLASSPTTRSYLPAIDTKQTIKPADENAVESPMGNIATASRSAKAVSTRNRSDIDILLSPEASAAQTLAVASALRFSAGLPTRKMLKERADEINLKTTSRASERSAHALATVTGSINETLNDSIKAISEPLPVSPIAEVRTAKRVKSESKHVVNVAGPIDKTPVQAIMPPMFAVAETIRRPVATAVAPLNNAVFTINIEDKPQPALNNSTVAVMPVKVNAVKTAPVTPVAPSAMKKSAVAAPASFSLNLQNGGYCDSNFVGPTITFAQTAELTLDDLLYQIHNRFGVNFIMSKGIGNLPINIKSGSIPWNTLLRSLLFVSGVRATCINSSTIELIQNNEVAALEKGRNDAAPLVTEFIKLKYLQPTISANGSASVAGGGGTSGFGGGGGGGGGEQGPCQNIGGGAAGGGNVQGGGLGGGQGSSRHGPQCRYEKLIREIEKILGVNNQQYVLAPTSVITRESGQTVFSDVQASNAPVLAGVPSTGSVTEIPGRNILVISAGQSQLDRIKKIIELADRPPFQVIIKGLIYTANETKLKDIGVQPSIFATTADGRTSGGIFGHTLGAGGTLFDFSTIIGTVDFMAQATAFQENGVISIKSRPFATVLEGDTADLTVGRQVPVLIQAQNNTGGIPGTLQILQAANLLTATPLIIDDENGNPIAVNLTLTLQSNEVDTSVTSQGVPSVSVRSVQSRFILNQQQTMILGGFTVDSDSRTVSKTPLLGDIPILGELFKRRLKSSQINRLYFAVAVEVVAFPTNPVPVSVPGVTADPPSITPNMKTRGDNAEPKQVVGPGKTGP